MSPNDPLSPALRTFAERQLGPLSRVHFCGWPHAESAVWALEGERRAFLKVFRQPRKFVQERHAYRAWVPQLAVAAARLPLLLDESEALRALLMSALPGTLLESAPLAPSQSLEAYRQAGAFLRALHTLTFRDDDPLSLAEATRHRAQAWLGRAEGIVARDLIAWVGEEAAEVAVMLTKLGAVRVPCHRDYTARNWLVAPTPEEVRLGVIDFEHARPDFWLFDTEKLYAEGWDAASEAAFWTGYGRTLTVAELRLLERHAALTALSTVVWARKHRDADFEAQGWAQLTRLRARQSATLSAGAAQ